MSCTAGKSAAFMRSRRLDGRLSSSSSFETPPTQELRVANCNYVTDVGLHWMSKVCKALHTLDIQNCNKVSNSGECVQQTPSPHVADLLPARTKSELSLRTPRQVFDPYPMVVSN